MIKGETPRANTTTRYIFPALGLASILSKSTTVTQSMIYASATSLAGALSPAEAAQRQLYPDLARIRDVSVAVAAGVIRAAQAAGVDREVRVRDLDDGQLRRWIRERMYDPHRETENVEREVRSLTGAAEVEKDAAGAATDGRSHL